MTQTGALNPSRQDAPWSFVAKLPASSCLGELVREALREQAELTVLPRKLPRSVGDAFVELDLQGFEDIRLRGSGSEVLLDVKRLLEHIAWPMSSIRQIGDDIQQIVDASASFSPTYTVRVEHVSDDACRRFHKDRTDVRMITTYRGRGTQWINADQATPETEISELETGEIGAFLGQREGGPGCILHRSPPTAPLDLSRLLLVVDIERKALV